MHVLVMLKKVSCRCLQHKADDDIDEPKNQAQTRKDGREDESGCKDGPYHEMSFHNADGDAACHHFRQLIETIPRPYVPANLVITRFLLPRQQQDESRSQNIPPKGIHKKRGAGNRKVKGFRGNKGGRELKKIK